MANRLVDLEKGINLKEALSEQPSPARPPPIHTRHLSVQTIDEASPTTKWYDRGSKSMDSSRRGTITALPNQVPRRNSYFAPESDVCVKAQATVEAAKNKSMWERRPVLLKYAIQYSVYTFYLAVIYFVFIGVPLWDGAYYAFWKAARKDSMFQAGFVLFVLIALGFAILPLFVPFEKDPLSDEATLEATRVKARSVALIIPCYRSEATIPHTLAAALKIFPGRNIFVVDNGNSPTALDGTQAICNSMGVRYIWSSMGCKIVAQLIGANAADEFPYTLLIDDDCLLPENFPLVTEQVELGDRRGLTKCVGYAISSSGPLGSKGNIWQQAQDLEYKSAGLQRYFAGLWGSAVFPHGAASLWEREFLLKCIRAHAGFVTSEDWYLGHACRSLGGRIKMSTQVFIKTETPTHLIHIESRHNLGRGGYGELTITKQRMIRWDFFLVWRMARNVKYLLFTWKLGRYDWGTKLWVFQDLYQTLLFLTFPIVVPIYFAIRPSFAALITAMVAVAYMIMVIFVNEVHLRRKNEMVSRKVVFLIYLPYKFYLRFVNILAVFYSVLVYATYFGAKKHNKILDNEVAMKVIVEIQSKELDPGYRRNSVSVGYEYAMPSPVKTSFGGGFGHARGLSGVSSLNGRVLGEGRIEEERGEEVRVIGRPAPVRTESGSGDGETGGGRV